MLLWFGDERQEYLQANFQLEAMRFDLAKVKVDLERLYIKKKLAEAQVQLIYNNIEFLKNYAKIVSIREYQILKYQLAGEIDMILITSKSIPPVEKLVKVTENKIRQLLISPAMLKFKVLEFKKRD